MLYVHFCTIQINITHQVIIPELTYCVFHCIQLSLNLTTTVYYKLINLDIYISLAHRSFKSVRKNLMVTSIPETLRLC